MGESQSRRGRPPKTDAGRGTAAPSNSVGIKDEYFMYDYDSDDVYEPGERRRMRNFKVSVPVQPRNANGTFAPCRSQADSQGKVSASSD